MVEKSKVASFPPTESSTDFPPGWFASHLVTSSTFPLMMIQQDSGVLCFATSSSE